MASPFAIYFYGVYEPGLDWLQGSSVISWTTQFSLPHLLEANKSNVIVVFETSGIILFFVGILGFALGAFQIYRGKLLENNLAITGVYRNIRHPQYLALIIASIGLLFVWPRFLVLFGTGTVIFIYLILVKTEKKICLAKFPDYADYMNTTGRFLPKGWVLLLSLTISGTAARFAGWITIYAAAMTIASFAAHGLRTYAIPNLYTDETENAVYLSTVTIRDEDLAKVAKITLNAPQAQPVRDAIAGGQYC
jgi:protein-S-isoprenylcysteine O-methyltransferase Ste14